MLIVQKTEYKAKPTSLLHFLMAFKIGFLCFMEMLRGWTTQFEHNQQKLIKKMQLKLFIPRMKTVMKTFTSKCKKLAGDIFFDKHKYIFI